jgi:FkbM family methyltransferase
VISAANKGLHQTAIQLRYASLPLVSFVVRRQITDKQGADKEETGIMSIKHTLRKLVWRAGYDISRYAPASHPFARMQQLLRSCSIDTVLDIGANTGQFGEFLRNDLGYRKKIISFEPLSSAFAVLKAKAGKDPYWDAFNIALGDIEGPSEINIAGNSYSSSLLDMLPSHSKSAPKSVYSGKETIEVRRLDSIFDSLCSETTRVYMKIDTQGFESTVLKGAERALQRISSVQMEMSLVPLYKGELLFNELYSFMENRGYSLVAIVPGFSDRESGQLLQVDGIFRRFD